MMLPPDDMSSISSAEAGLAVKEAYSRQTSATSNVLLYRWQCRRREVIGDDAIIEAAALLGPRRT